VRRLLPVLALIVFLAATAPPAAAKTCNQSIHIRDGLASVATVLSARNMKCRSARKVVRRDGPDAEFEDRVGSLFRMGRFRCRVTFVREESRRARCRRGERVFRVDYGS